MKNQLTNENERKCSGCGISLSEDKKSGIFRYWSIPRTEIHADETICGALALGNYDEKQPVKPRMGMRVDYVR